MRKKIINIVENSKVSHPIRIAAENGSRYWSDFIQVTDDYEKVLSKKEYDHFLDKSHLDCNIGIAQYLQFSSEVTVVDYIIRNYSKFKNEPKYNGNKNPECSFFHEGRTINIEVKCPDLTKRIKQENSIGAKLYTADRFPNKNEFEQTKVFLEMNMMGDHYIQTIDRMDNKLKDYLISAHQKFPVSNISNFNILVIALDIIADMDEWYSYLIGENGVFTDRTYIKEDYSNVDAVLLTTVQHGHMKPEAFLDENCWHLESYYSILILDPRKERVNGLGKYYIDTAISLFGKYTESFLFFLQQMNQNNVKRDSEINDKDLDENQKKYLLNTLYIEDRINSLHLISKWIKTLEDRNKHKEIDND